MRGRSFGTGTDITTLVGKGELEQLQIRGGQDPRASVAIHRYLLVLHTNLAAGVARLGVYRAHTYFRLISLSKFCVLG